MPQEDDITLGVSKLGQFDKGVEDESEYPSSQSGYLSEHQLATNDHQVSTITWSNSRVTAVTVDRGDPYRQLA